MMLGTNVFVGQGSNQERGMRNNFQVSFLHIYFVLSFNFDNSTNYTNLKTLKCFPANCVYTQKRICGISLKSPLNIGRYFWISKYFLSTFDSQTVDAVCLWSWFRSSFGAKKFQNEFVVFRWYMWLELGSCSECILNCHCFWWTSFWEIIIPNAVCPCQLNFVQIIFSRNTDC